MSLHQSVKKTRTTLYTLLVVFLVLTIISCAKKASFVTSSAVPAARGDVKVKKDGNNNYLIKIKIYNLAEARRLEPAKQVYTVWLESGEHVIKNLGQINSSSSLVSKTLKAGFETVSSIKPIRIFITAEDVATVEYPGSNLILTTSNF